MRLKDTNETFVKKHLAFKKIGCTIGGDPEFFVATKASKILSADKFFPSKHNPIVINYCDMHDVPNKLFFDGIQAEMAISYSRCREYVNYNIFSIFQNVYNKIGEDHKIVLKPSVKVQKKVIDEAAPEAREFGCLPDFNAYTCTTNTIAMDASAHPFRYAGGHVHLGVSSAYLSKKSREYKVAHKEVNHLRIIKCLDLILSIPTLFLDNEVGAKRRRTKYGKAGCFRPTPYGIEYRTPSCWWLKSPFTSSLVTGLARIAWNLVVYGEDAALYKKLKIDTNDVRGIIDESDTKEAYKLWETMRPYVIQILDRRSNPLHIDAFGCSDTGDKIYPIAILEYAIKNGLHSVINKDVKENWIGDFNSKLNVMECMAKNEYSEHFKSISGVINAACTQFKKHQEDFMNFQKSFFNSIL